MTFYTYAHVRESDSKVFYVGKGHGRRAWNQGARSFWWKKTRAKHGLRVEILARWPSEAEAFAHERLLIACFRELAHPLVNLTAGGEGFQGGKHTLEWRQKMSARTKGRPGKPLSEETKAKLSAVVKANPPKHWLGKHHSPEALAKRSVSRRARATKFSDASGTAMSAAQWSAHLGLHITTIHYRIKTKKLVRVEEN